MQKIWTYSLAILALLCITSLANAQNVGINSTGTTPHNSAMLDITSTNKGLLIPRMDSTSRKNIMTPAEGLMVFDSTYNSFWYHDGTTWTRIGGGSSSADNLGNHTATQNVQLNNNWLNNDGGANEGINIDANGQVGIGKVPTTFLDVDMGSRTETIISQTTSNASTSGFSGSGSNSVCQSFTAPQNGTLHSIEFSASGSRSSTYKLYEGLGNGGNALTSSIFQASPGAPYLFSGITLTAGQVYTIEIITAINVFAYSTTDVYAGGQICTQSGFDYWFKVNYEFTNSGGFKVSNTAVQINDYSLPISDGTNGQVLSTNGTGTASWSTISIPDNQDLSLSGNTLSLTNDPTSIDLSSYLDNTDAQDLGLSGNTLSLTNDATSVDLGSFLDNTDAQDLSLSGNALSLTNDATSVDLSSYLDNTDAQDLGLSGNTLSLTNDATSVDLSGYLDNTDAQDLSLSGNTLSLTNDGSNVDLSSFAGGSDDLGSHTATQTLQLNNNWINNDGGAAEGLHIDNNGNVGVNTVPSANFHVAMGQNSESILAQVGSSSTSIGTTSAWQSFTATENADLTRIIINITNFTGTGNYTLHQGEGTSGSVLVSGSQTFVSGNNTFNFTNISLIKNQVYTISIVSGSGTNFPFNDTNPYSGGRTGFNITLDMEFSVYHLISIPGFRVDNTGVTINAYTLPSTDGNANQILTTDGAGVVTWNSAGAADNLGNHTATQNIQLSGQWLSNDGGNEGIQIDNSGNVSVATKVNINSGNVDGILSVGNGAADGTGAPSDGITFHNTNAGGFGQAAIYTDGISGFNGDLVFATDGDDTQNYNSTEKMRVGHNGKVGIGRTASTNLLEVGGNASKTTAGNWLANSDARLKKNITPLSSQEILNKMLSLQGVTYEWNDTQTKTKRPEGLQYGFTAQNIQNVFPTLVSVDNAGFLQTPYGTYDAMTVEAIRALNDKIIQLQEQLAQEQSKSAQLETRIAGMEQLERRLESIETLLKENSSANEQEQASSER